MGKLLSMNEYLLFTSAHLDINFDGWVSFEIIVGIPL